MDNLLMKQSLFLILIQTLIGCGSIHYDRTLEVRINEIREFKGFDNTPVAHSDSFRIKMYSRPNRVYNSYHPYQFLRDTARTEDLILLLNDENQFVRTYAFAALSRRKIDLFPLLLEHLSDSAKFYVAVNDYGYQASTADMMIQYVLDELTIGQKDSIQNLILSKYDNLEVTKNILLFHEPIPDHYECIKRIAKSGHQGKFALVALSRYQNSADLELIKEGFNLTDYYNGYKVFFMAIEEFNHKEFKEDLINYKSSINKGFNYQGYDYYFNALAKYSDPECLNVIREFVEFDDYQSDIYKLKSLRLLWRSLKKYNCPEYHPLIKQIESNFQTNEKLDYDDNHLIRNSWNY